MSASPAQNTPALELKGVVKRFGSTLALDGVDFAVAPRQVHALLGENGAGKSTAMRIAFGLEHADSGSIHVLGAELRRHSVQAATRAGLGMVHQHLSLVPTLTAAESLALGGHGLFRHPEAEARLRSVSRASGLHVEPSALVAELSLVEQQRLEILKGLARDARVLILDEPTAVLAPSESEELLRWLRQFADGGGSVVLVTHKLREAIAIADAITVLRRGRVVLATDARNAAEGELARAMFPDAPAPQPVPIVDRGSRVVNVVDADIPGARGLAIRGASLQINAGEILGVAAVEGSGHRELLRAIAGLAAPARGTVELPRRIGAIPADRTRDGIIGEFSLTENVALHGLGERRGLMRWPALRNRTRALVERFAITASSPDARARSLSGGNQQRLVVARELEQNVELLVADNPTRGLDLRASAFVHDQIRQAAAQGAAVVVHSSDLDEVLSLASRVVVVFNGIVIACERDRAAISRAMVGATE